MNVCTKLYDVLRLFSLVYFMIINTITMCYYFTAPQKTIAGFTYVTTKKKNTQLKLQCVCNTPPVLHNFRNLCELDLFLHHKNIQVVNNDSSSHFPIIPNYNNGSSSKTTLYAGRHTYHYC